jgi:hypothetical protein
VSPQHCEGRGTTHHGLPHFLSVEALEQKSGFKRAISSGVDIHEVDPVPPVQPAHKSDFFSTQGALAVEPDPHPWLMVLHVLYAQVFSW